MLAVKPEQILEMVRMLPVRKLHMFVSCFCACNIYVAGVSGHDMSGSSMIFKCNIRALCTKIQAISWSIDQRCDVSAKGLNASCVQSQSSHFQETNFNAWILHVHLLTTLMFCLLSFSSSVYSHCWGWCKHWLSTRIPCGPSTTTAPRFSLVR